MGFLAQFTIEAGDFRAHLFENLGLVDADAGPGDAQLLRDLLGGCLFGNELEDLSLGFVDVALDIVPGIPPNRAR